MCGIVATIGVDPGIVAAHGTQALRVLSHRGPDDEGSWSDGQAWLGHRRLAIIDLTAGGHQPMVHEASGVVITFNGEIYNYIELRAELESAGLRFRTRSDTEVLLAAYLHWGEDCLRRLNGMWAFLVWDPRNQRAFFARDRLGVKPLYFALVGEGLSVASEPKALLALFPHLRVPDEAALYAFLAEGQLYTAGRSFYEGIQTLQPGHCGTFDPADSAPKIRLYWRPPVFSGTTIDYRESAEVFGDLFEDAVRLRMRSDVPVGFTLSGGLDSSAVVGSAASQAPDGARLHAFTSTYETTQGSKRIDERDWAARVANRYESVDLEQVPAGESDWLGVLERILWHMDGPGYSPAVFPLWKIMQRARASGIPVLLEGQGADELLGGYTQHAAVAIWESLSGLHLAGFSRDFRSYAATFPIRMLVLWLIRERLGFAKPLYRRRVGALGAMDPDFVRRFYSGDPVAPRKRLSDRLTADLTRDVLPGLLHYGDAISMAHSIEVRLPFLDYRLVEFICSLPSLFKVGEGQTKRVLRDHLRAVGLPEIADRRDKQGYPTPMDEWLRADYGAVLRSVLLPRDAAIHAYCRPEGLKRLIDRHVAGSNATGNHLYRLLTTELWLKAGASARA